MTNAAVHTQLTKALVSASVSDPGRSRSENQDSFCVLERDTFCFYAVADGVGGVRGGAVASQLAISSVTQFLSQSEFVDEEVLRRAIDVANREVYRLGRRHSALKGLGTTIVGLAFAGSKLFVLNVGDSRAYRFRDGALRQLSRDHTIAEELVREGTITREQARTNPMGHVLSRSIGAGPTVRPDCYLCDEEPRADDIYLICSDGLYGQLTLPEIEAQIREGMNSRISLKAILQKLTELCNEKGGPDNITGVLVRLGGAYPRAALSLEGEPNVTRIVDRFVKPEVEQKRFSKKFLTKLLPTVATGLIGLTLGLIVGTKYSSLSILNGKPDGSTATATSGVEASQTSGRRVGQGNTLTDPGQASQISFLDTEMAELQSEIDQITKTLVMWHDRQKLLGGPDFDSIVSELAETSLAVRKKKVEYDQINVAYLTEAENLVYNSSTDSQERKVEELAQKRQESLESLKTEVQLAIVGVIGELTDHISELSKRREAARMLRKSLPSS